MNKKLVAIMCIVFIGIVVTFVVATSLIPKYSLDRFKSIPSKPNDFDAYTRDIWKGAFVDLCEIEDNYYKQPEFYGDSWKNAKKSFYDNPDYSMWGVYGQGNTPKEISYSFSNLKPNDEFELCTFFHNGFGVWTYQGFKLQVRENEMFDVEITPNELTMSPTFPVFEEGWTQKINIKLKAKENIKSGEYVIIFDAVAPSPEYAREKTKEVLKLTIDKNSYKKECLRFLKDEERCEFLINNREKKYIDGGAYQSSEPLLKLTVDVK